MQPTDWLTRGTAWGAFIAWVWATMLLLALPGQRERFVNRLWLGAALLMLLHVLLAFHRVHEWSHPAAVADTARQTRELTGIDWGGGIWLNYLLAAVWLADAVWRVTAPVNHARRPRGLMIALHGFLGFMWFNATVVFGSWVIRSIGLVAFALLAWCWWRERLARRSTQLPAPRESS